MSHNPIIQVSSILWATHYLDLYKQAMGWQNPEDIVVDIMGIYDHVIYPEHEFTLDMRTDLGMHENKKVLGKTMPQEQIIAIDRSIAPPIKDPRLPFTLAHEIGHAVLHQQENLQLLRCTESDKNEQIEQEANYFASQLLMPPDLVLYRYKEHYGSQRAYPYTGPGTYAINFEKIQIYSLSHLSHKLAEPLTSYFSNVSKESLGYTLFNIGLINNQTNEKMRPRMLFLPPNSMSNHGYDIWRGQ